MAKARKVRKTKLKSFMAETNGGGYPEDVPGFDFFRAATAGFHTQSISGPTILTARPDGGFFSSGRHQDEDEAAGYGKGKQESVIGVDNRVRVPETSLTPWRCICHLEIQYDHGPTGYGTGFLAGEDLVLTAAHVLVDRSRRGWAKPPRRAKRVRIIPGRDARLAPYGTIVCDIPGEGDEHDLIPTEWMVENADDPLVAETDAAEVDYAGIRLTHGEIKNQKIGQRLGYFGFKDFAKITKDDREMLFVNTAGYPHVDDKPLGTQWYNAGRTNALGTGYDGFLEYMADTERGQSGSPVYYFDKIKDERLVVAIHTTGDFINRGLLITGDIFDQIREWRGHD